MEMLQHCLLASTSAVAIRPPVGSTSLAPRVWLTRNLIPAAEAALLREAALVADAYPCPMQEESWPLKRCTKLPVPTALATALASAWPELNLTRLATIAATIDGASTSCTLLHKPHHDVYPEREPGTRGPDATAVIYLSEAAGHPPELSAPTIFPRVGVSVAPAVGSMLAWANVRENGNAEEDAQHAVGPYTGAADLPPRIALHVPISFSTRRGGLSDGKTFGIAQPEHVGCGRQHRIPHDVMQLAIRTARPYTLALRWQMLSAELRRRVVSVLVRRWRVVARTSAMLLQWHARATERMYQPGGVGYVAAALEFAQISDAQQPGTMDGGGGGGGPHIVGDDAGTDPADVGSEGEGGLGGSEGVVAALATAAVVATVAAQVANARRERKAAIEAELERLHDEYYSHAAAIGRGEDARLAELMRRFRMKLLYKRLVSLLHEAGVRAEWADVCVGRLPGAALHRRAVDSPVVSL